MNNKIQTYYVDYEAAKLLKKLGFNVSCELYYEWYPHFHHLPLTEDEEYEMESEGRKDEIVYKELIQRMYNTNEQFKKSKHCSCPSLDITRDWILDNFNIFISPRPYWMEDNMSWICEIWKIVDKKYMRHIKDLMYKENNISALADGIEYALNYINSHKNERKKD